MQTNNITRVAKVPTPTLTSVTSHLQATGTIQAVAKANLIDNDFFTLDDGAHTPTVFEFDVSGTAVIGGGHVRINVSAATTAASVGALVTTAINGVTTSLAITASNGSLGLVNLVQDNPKLTGAGDNSENVANAGFTISGMTNPTAAETWGYKIVGVALDGSTTNASSQVTTTSGGTHLSSTALNTLVWTDPTNAVFVQIFRTAVGGGSDTPSTTGLIGTVAAGVQTFDDTGLAGDSSTAPSSNGTGDSTSIEVGSLRDLTVHFYGGFSATYSLQMSLDGINWFQISSVSTDSVVDVTSTAKTVVFLRIKETAYTSGTPVIVVAGHAER